MERADELEWRNNYRTLFHARETLKAFELNYNEPLAFALCEQYVEIDN